MMVLLLSQQVLAKNLVFIHSYHFEYPWVGEYRIGFLNSIDEVTIHDFQMDTKRKPASEFEAIADQAWKFIESKNADLVLLADDNALKFLGPRLVSKEIPFIFLGINANPRNYIPITSVSSGVLERPLLKRSVFMVNKVIPGVKRVLVLMDSAHTSNAIIETAFNNKMKQDVLGIYVETRKTEDFATWQREIVDSEANGFDAVIIANYAALSDVHGQNVSLDDVSEWTSKNTPLPLFAFWSYSVGENKAVGGLSISALEQGITAAEQANEFLRSGTMPPIITPKRGAFIFSRSELAKWGLELPEDILSKAVLKD
ncbi:hypothetical protein J4N39_06640 [Vibrio sp. SCSIO 43136]|nr:hypothetical protein J4N39_06640 [Vibrio sp. SCSIO 43136]